MAHLATRVVGPLGSHLAAPRYLVPSCPSHCVASCSRAVTIAHAKRPAPGGAEGGPAVEVLGRNTAPPPAPANTKRRGKVQDFGDQDDLFGSLDPQGGGSKFVNYAAPNGAPRAAGQGQQQQQQQQAPPPPPPPAKRAQPSRPPAGFDFDDFGPAPGPNRSNSGGFGYNNNTGGGGGYSGGNSGGGYFMPTAPSGGGYMPRTQQGGGARIDRGGRGGGGQYRAPMRLDFADEEEAEPEEVYVDSCKINNKTMLCNHGITAREVFLLGSGPERKALGVMPTSRAIELAHAEKQDLLLINPDASPPLARIVKWGKYKFELEKAAKEKKSGATVQETKEVRLRPVTDVGDINVKKNAVQKFIQKGNKVKIVMKFEGREMQYKEQGKEVLLKFIEELGECVKVEGPLNFKSATYIILLAPTGKV